MRGLALSRFAMNRGLASLVKYTNYSPLCQQTLAVGLSIGPNLWAFRTLPPLARRLRPAGEEFADASDDVVLGFAVHFGVDREREDLFAEAFGGRQREIRVGGLLKCLLFIERHRVIDHRRNVALREKCV